MRTQRPFFAKWLFIFVTLISFAGLGRASAQSTGAPLVIQIGGDYFASEASSTPTTPKPLTNWGYNQQAVMSPDSTHFAYLSYPQTVVDALELSTSPLIERPTNIWLINPATGNNQKLADQPPEADFFSAETPDNAVVRSLPAWSSDGKKLAWTEFALPNADNQKIVVYDLASDTATTVASVIPAVPHGADQSALTSLLWVGDWFVVHSSASANDALLVYGQDGSLHQTIAFNVDPSRVPLILLPVGSQVAVYYSTGAWEVVDPDSGTVQPASSAPELYSLNPASSGSVTISTSVNSDHTLSVQVVDSQGNPAGEPVNVGQSLDGVVLSRNGTGAATISNGVVAVWRGGKTDPVPSDGLATRLIWGGSAWRIAGGAGGAGGAACPGAMPAQLTVGGQGRVVPGTGSSNLRAKPSRQGAQKGVINEGEIFKVMAGPKCADGMLWWGINYNGATGWMAEGKDNEYYIEPVSS